jgi:hypothetical protein
MCLVHYRDHFEGALLAAEERGQGELLKAAHCQMQIAGSYLLKASAPSSDGRPKSRGSTGPDYHPDEVTKPQASQSAQ